MSSAIIELQKEISSSECDVTSVLRHAHLIASKLNLSDFDKWINYELNGYSTLELVPDYRTVKGSIKSFNPFNGWIPVVVSNQEIEERLTTFKLYQSISEIIALCEKNNTSIIFEYTGKVQNVINKACNPPIDMQVTLHVSTASVLAVIEKVKNVVLDWTIELEKNGVFGKEYMFNEDEKKTAKELPNMVNIYYGSANIINGDINQSAIDFKNENEGFDYEKIKEVIFVIEEKIKKEEINKENEEKALELLEDIRDKIDEKNKPQIIKSAMIALRDFLINSGSTLVGGILQAKIMGLF